MVAGRVGMEALDGCGEDDHCFLHRCTWGNDGICLFLGSQASKCVAAIPPTRSHGSRSERP